MGMRARFAWAVATGVVVACGGSTSTTGGSVDAGGDAGPSDAGTDVASGDAGSCADRFFGALDKSCAGDGDCTTFHHDDCCGTVVVGIRAGTAAAAMAAEQAFLACESGCGGRGCLHADMAEDGRSVLQGDGGGIVVGCAAGRCMTRVP